MKYLSVIKRSVYPFLLMLAVLVSSCIKEDLDACYKLTLKVENAKGDDITTLDGEVKSALLFVYDENGKLLEKRSLDEAFITSRKEILLDYPANKNLHIVAWGNAEEGNQELKESDELSQLAITLKSQNDLAQSPDRLYYGNKDVTTVGNGTVSGGDQEIVIRCKVGTITMETIGLENVKRLKGLKSTTGLNFYMDRTLNTFNAEGTLVGDSVYYNPDNQTKAATPADIETIDPNNVVAGENLTFRLNLGGNNEYTRTTDDDNKPFATAIENNTHVQFIFGEDGTLSVKVKVTPWGVVDDDVEL